MKKLYYLFCIVAMLAGITACSKTEDLGGQLWQKQSENRLTVDDAKNIFNREVLRNYSRSGSIACEMDCGHDHSSPEHVPNPNRGMFNPGIITPDWSNSTIISDRSGTKVVTPINTTYRYVAARKEKDKYGKSSGYKSTVVQRLYVAKDDKGGNIVYIEVLIPDKNSRGEKNMPAELIGSKYSGIAMYYTVDNGFGWYYMFKGGKIVERISIYDVTESNAEKINARMFNEIGRIIKYQSARLSRNGNDYVGPTIELDPAVVTPGPCNSCGSQVCICHLLCIGCNQLNCHLSCLACPVCKNVICTCNLTPPVIYPDIDPGELPPPPPVGGGDHGSTTNPPAFKPYVYRGFLITSEEAGKMFKSIIDKFYETPQGKKIIDYFTKNNIEIQVWYNPKLPEKYAALYSYESKQIQLGPNANNRLVIYEEVFHAYDHHVNPYETSRGNREALAKLFIYQMQLEEAKKLDPDRFITNWKPWTISNLKKYLADPTNEKAVKWLGSALDDRGYPKNEFPRDLNNLDPKAFNDLFETQINLK